MSTTAGVGIATGAAKRCRERRLRSWLRHERMTVAMALAEVTHHTAPRGQKTVRVRPQERVLRHVVEDLGMVQILDSPVPQMVDYVMYAFRLLDRPIAEQVIEVPKFSCSPCPSRSPIPEPQSAEQLVEVPTVLTPTRIALRVAGQVVDTQIPRGRGQGSLPGQSTTATSSSLERIPERTVEQIVDIFFCW